MIYLISTSHTRSALSLYALADVGAVMTPNSCKPSILRAYQPQWAADNGCWSHGEAFDLTRYLSWLTRMLPYQPKCLFATAPDVVGDALATWELSQASLPLIRQLGYGAALVAQDGIEHQRIEWRSFDALFIGGSTDWKLSEAAHLVIREAKARGKWVHMGRVNSARRFTAARLAGCDSADGTFISYAPDANSEILRGWLSSQDKNPTFPKFYDL